MEMRVGVIDIGSNTTRLLVASAGPDGLDAEHGRPVPARRAEVRPDQDAVAHGERRAPGLQAPGEADDLTAVLGPGEASHAVAADDAVSIKNAAANSVGRRVY